MTASRARMKSFLLTLAAVLSPCVALAAPLYPAGTTTMHIAFNGAPNTSQPVVKAAAVFNKEDGYGFSISPTVKDNSAGVQADKFMRFDVALPDGNYDVSVTVGNPTLESTTTIRSEAHRPAAADVHTRPKQFVPVKFTVNIHKDVTSRNDLNSDGCLHLEFIGENPSFTAIDIVPNTTAPTVYIIGDSTACDYNSDPRVGWGEMFPLFFKPGEIAISNCARSGRSAKSFIAERRLDDVMSVIKPGDFMLIQFAHNDQKDTTLTPESWKAVLMNYIDGARAKKAQVIMITSMPRRQFDENNKIKNSLGHFPQTTRDLAAEQKVPLVDLNAKATEFFDILGPEGTKKAFCYYTPDVYTGFARDNADNTHFNPYGAYELAKIVAREIKAANIDLSSKVIDNLEPMNTDSTKFPASLDYNPLRIEKK